eukprot:333370-Pleurochrysis_carterae.AAC.1
MQLRYSTRGNVAHIEIKTTYAGGERSTIDALWAGDWARDDKLSPAAENADLCEFLESSTVNGKDVRYRGLKAEQLKGGGRSRW